MNDLGNVFKALIVIVILFFAFGFIFRVLFKIGLLVVLVLGILYLYKKVFSSKSKRYK